MARAKMRAPLMVLLAYAATASATLAAEPATAAPVITPAGEGAQARAAGLWDVARPPFVPLSSSQRCGALTPGTQPARSPPAAAETLTFFAVSDWGGQEVAPYTTPLQVAMAETMGRVSASFHPKFILSAGGNFLPAGMPGASQRRPARVRAPSTGRAS